MLLQEVKIFFLSEGRKESVQEKYPNNRDEIDYFVSRDPSGKYKYLDWEMKILTSGQALKEEIADVVDLFDKYQQRLSKKDISQYGVSDFTDLRDQLFSFRDASQSKKEKNKERYHLENIPDAKTVYESDNWTVLLIKNKEASCHFGLGAKWCVAMKQEAYFESYDSNNVVFFYVLSKTLSQSDKNYKLACSVQRDKNNNIVKTQWWNALDEQINKTIKRVLGKEYTQIENVIKNVAVAQPKSILARLASNEATAEEIQQVYDTVKNSENEKERTTVIDLIVQSDNVPNSVLKDLTSDHDTEIRTLVARFAKSHDVLEFLSQDDDIDVRVSVAWNVNTTSDILDSLVYDSHDEVRKAAIFNKNTSLSTLQSALSKENNSDLTLVLKQAVVEHASSEDEIIRLYNTYFKNRDSLNDESNDLIIRAMAKNSNTPVSVLQDMLKYVTGSMKYIINVELLMNRQLPEDMFRKLADSEDILTRLRIAQNPNTPEDVLRKLANDAEQHIAYNTNTPEDVLRKLALSRIKMY